MIGLDPPFIMPICLAGAVVLALFLFPATRQFMEKYWAPVGAALAVLFSVFSKKSSAPDLSDAEEAGDRIKDEAQSGFDDIVSESSEASADADADLEEAKAEAAEVREEAADSLSDIAKIDDPEKRVEALAEMLRRDQ